MNTNLFARVRVLWCCAALMLALLFAPTAAHPAGAGVATATVPDRIVTWTGAGDGRWSDRANWQDGRVPGKQDVVRIPASASADILLDPDFAGQIGSLTIEPGYAGTLTLARSLTIRGDLTMSSGSLVGGDAPLVVVGSATVSGGILTTPHSLVSAKTLTIAQGGVVRLGANGKLNLTGDGTPLMGNGLLDVTTNAPNSVEYTGRATSDITAAGPATTYRELAGAPVGGTRGKAGGVLPFAAATFSETGSLTLTRGEDNLSSAVIDTANGFAYFGTGTSPGIVVKVRLSDFTRVGALTLNAGEGPLISAVIDTANGFAYFGTADYFAPASVVKVRLSDFTRVGALTLELDVISLTSAVIDTANGYAYFGGVDTVVKVRLSDFTRVGVLTLNLGSSLSSAVIDTVNGYAYFGTYTWPGIVVKVRLADFTRVGALTLNGGESDLTSAVIDTANGFAYFGGGDFYSVPGFVVKVRLSDLARVGALALNVDELEPRSAVIDPANGYAYFGMNTSPASVVKVRLADFTRAGALTLPAGEYWLTSAVIDSANGYAYFGMNTSPASVVKVRLADFTRVGALLALPRENGLTSALLDSAGGFAYFAAHNADAGYGAVIKVRLSDFSVAGALALYPNEHPNVAVIDAPRGYAYFGSNPQRSLDGWGYIVKVRLPDFTRVGALVLGIGYGSLDTAVIDPDNGFAYFGDTCWTNKGNMKFPTTVHKIRLSDFTEVGQLDLNQGEWAGSAAIDTVNGFAYFGTGTALVKIRLSDFTRVDSLAQGIQSGVIDTHNGYGYFGSGSTIVKVRLSDFTQVDSLMLSMGETPNLAIIDTENGYAYFAGGNSIVSVRLSDFTRVDSLTLRPGECCLSSAVIDTANSDAYFGTDTSPGVVVKVDIRSTDLVVAQQASAATASARDALTYTLDLSNGSPDAATGLMLTDTLPVSATFVSVNPGPTTCNLSGGQVICGLGTLAAGASTQVAIQMLVATTDRGVLTNSASVSANGPRFSTPKTATLTTIVNPLRTWLSWIAR